MAYSAAAKRLKNTVTVCAQGEEQGISAPRVSKNPDGFHPVAHQASGSAFIRMAQPELPQCPSSSPSRGDSNSNRGQVISSLEGDAQEAHIHFAVTSLVELRLTQLQRNLGNVVSRQ